MTQEGKEPDKRPRHGAEDDLWLPVDHSSRGSSVLAAGNEVELPKSDRTYFPVVDEIAFIPIVSKRQIAFVAASNRVAAITDWAQQNWREEQNQGGFFLWMPVWFGIGCSSYFALPREPLPFAFPALLVLLILFTVLARNSYRLKGFLIVACLLVAGVTVAQIQTHKISTPMASSSIIAIVNGQVERVEVRADGRVRYTIVLTGPVNAKAKDSSLKSVERVRLTARKGGPGISVGNFIRGRARFGAPPGPAFPGAYDFSFYNWFDGIGASGFFLGAPEKAPQIPHQMVGTWALGVSKMRAEIASIIRQTLPGPAGGIATALIVGDRSGVDEGSNEALRKSGLAHILAISGLHMALVAATMIFIMRALFACMPSVALHYPVRKWSSLIALIAAGGYLILSGASISTQRAFVMVAIMLVAVLLDRRALTMRNVALAALIILLLSPHAILSPGFQMSFAAVAALVATFEITMKARRAKNIRYDHGILGAIKRFALRDVGGLATTSFVAGLATGLFAAYHFYRVAPFGLVANLLAMPIVSLAVMPLALISTLLMPFGLESVPLSLLAITTNWVVDIAQGVSQLGPSGSTGLIPIPTLLWGTLALLIACLMRSRLKMLSIPVLCVAAFSLVQKQVPDILILENGRQLGVLYAGKVNLLRPNAEKFSTSIWRAAFAASNTIQQNAQRGEAGRGFQCDEFGCVATVKGVTLVHVSNTSLLYEDCRIADILVIPYRVPDACSHIPREDRPLIIDQTTLQKYGAHRIQVTSKMASETNRHEALRTAKQQISVMTAYSKNPRPWTRHRNPQDKRNQ